MLDQATRNSVCFVKGRAPQECWRVEHAGVRILLSTAHPQPEQVLARAIDMIEIAHPRLRAPLRWLGLPHDTIDGIEPGPPGSTPAAAVPHEGLIIIWGREHANRGFVAFDQCVFEHELAHLAGATSAPGAGGPPHELQDAWRSAMRADAADHARHAVVPRPFVERVTIHGAITRHFHLGQTMLNNHVSAHPQEDGIVEDWAESVELHCLQMRRGWLWQEDDAVLRFHEWWPHRSALLDEWFA